jgi:hypothetical protein
MQTSKCECVNELRLWRMAHGAVVHVHCTARGAAQTQPRRDVLCFTEGYNPYKYNYMGENYFCFCYPLFLRCT